MKITLLYKLMAMLMSVMMSLGIGAVNPPDTSDPIIKDDNANITFIAWGDTQVSSYMPARALHLKSACEDIANSGIGFDALVLAGDVAENGLNAEYVTSFDYMSKINTDVFLIAEGNHDVRLRAYKQSTKRFCTFVNSLNEAAGNSFTTDGFNYSYDVNGYKFIVLGTDKTEFEESYFSAEQLEWLDKELASACGQGNPVFVINHQPFALTHGLPDTWGSPIDSAGSIGKQSDEIFTILNKYENVIFITGHLHTSFGDNLYEKKDKVHLVNLPSLGINNKDGIYNEAGIGFVVSVTDDGVIFRARDFSLGKYIPEGDITIQTSK